MPRAGSARTTANRIAAGLGWRGARGGTAGAARARGAYVAAKGAAATYRAEALAGAGVGTSANDAQRAWNREVRSERYREFRARAEEVSGAPTAASAKRFTGKWDSEFNRLYRDAAADGFSNRKGGAYQRLLERIGWTVTKDEKIRGVSPKVKTWLMGQKKAGGIF